MISRTKDKIAHSAIELFNASGLGAINLLEIAQDLGMSRGNLAYHFKNKDAILDFVAQLLEKDIEKARKKRLNLPAFSNLQIDIQSYHSLQKKYAFIFENNAALNHEAIRRVMSAWAETTILSNMEAFAFAIDLGNMHPEKYPGTYRHLAMTTWILTYYWLAQKAVRGVSDAEDAEKTVWSLIIPHFTEKGLTRFQSFFGKNYLNTLGPPFDPAEMSFDFF